MDADSRTLKPRYSRWLSAALFLCASVAAIYLLSPQTLGEQARRSIVQIFREHYRGTEVTIGSGRYSNDVGLILEDLEFRTPRTASTPSQSLLRIDRLIVETDLRPEKLLDRELPFCAKRIIAQGVELNAAFDANGESNLSRLWPPPKMGPGCPRFEIRDGRVRIHRDQSTLERPIELDGMNIVIDVVPGEKVSSLKHQFVLHASSNYFKNISLKGTEVDSRLELQGNASHLRIDPTLISRLPMLSAATVESLAGLTTEGDLKFSAVKIAKAPLDFLAIWKCDRGRYEHPRLPQPIDKVSGSFSMRPSGITIDAAQGYIGDAVCRVIGKTTGWSTDSDVTLRLVASNLLFNERITSSLPLSAQRALDRIRPRGPLDLDARLDRVAGKWKADAVADLHGVELNVDRFPYPVSQVIGKVHFRDSQVWTERLSGRVSEQRICVAFLRSEPASGKPSWLRLAADGPVPIDSLLLSGLTPRGEGQTRLEAFVRSLSPRGNVHLVSGEWNTSEIGEKTQSIDLRVSGGSLRYSGFPYALYDVTGQVLVKDTKTSLVNFTAKNSDNAKINCEGLFEDLAKNAIGPEGAWRVGLRFQAQDLPLDETIRAALPSSTQQTWDSLAPAGVLDFLDVQVSHAQKFTAPKLIISAKQQLQRTVDSRTVSLRPSMLPYRLDVAEGAVQFDGEQVLIESLDAKHDSTRVTADGYCNRTNTDQWQLVLNLRSGSRLHPDSELVNSLPAQVRGAFQRLQLRGPLSIRGTTSILLPDQRHPDPTIDWGLTVQLEGNRIGDVGPVHDIRGELLVNGRSDGFSVVADGVVGIDSIHIDDKQVSSIRGPFAIRDDRLLLGETIAVLDAGSALVPSPTLKLNTVSPIQGSLFGGVATMSGDVTLSNGNFDVAIAIRDGDVATLLADLGETDSAVKGKVEGRVRLAGTVGAAHLLKGSGSGKLTEANLYQLPILVQMFNMIRVKPSEAVAFTDGDVRFSIYGDTVTFNQLQLWGDLIALHGSGTMTRTKDVDLSFNTRVSPQNGWSEIMRPFGDNQYTLWTISVKGPLSDPVIERRTLNTVNDTIERLFPGMAHPVRPSGRISSRVEEVRERVFK